MDHERSLGSIEKQLEATSTEANQVRNACKAHMFLIISLLLVTCGQGLLAASTLQALKHSRRAMQEEGVVAGEMPHHVTPPRRRSFGDLR